MHTSSTPGRLYPAFPISTIHPFLQFLAHLEKR
jgi:hypothetical protein